ncbi:uncharacterized protein LOC131666308 isoform X2 [Phymastichus coffea]|uniref:uncharacterized protein LOC131666308 isoform X2 n=1 Tax=Phymastichus coffea TaxID=108790 RepID=UPI00273C98A5|nr:uncharacterized protein LOC131666308 isoform X2 [Phymastichus coffea]
MSYNTPLYWRKRNIFYNAVNIWNYTSLKKDLSTLVDWKNKLHEDEKLSNKQSIMKQESEKPMQKLNFKTLLNYGKRKVNVEIVSAATVKKKSKATVDIELMKEELKQLEDPPVTLWEKQISSTRLPYSFYDVPSKNLARNLLVLVRKLENGTVLKGRIVETESYLGVEDKASHTYQGKVTHRNIPMYMPPGTIYVYFTYGMYHCFNISSQEKGSAVLIRALEPLVGIEYMAENRSWKPKPREPKKLMKNLKIHELCNGPSKICIALQLVKQHSRYSLCNWKELWIEDDGKQGEFKIVECPRIGIESAGAEWANKPLRYYVYGHKCVSKRDKKAESIFQ